MNTFMWESPFTAQHLHRLRQLGVVVIDPVAKKLACGDVGNGAMAAPETIAAAVQAALAGLKLD
jgi:phosphopantothenoylcysteine decarboxylase